MTLGFSRFLHVLMSLFPSERTSLLQRVVCPQLAASLWAASAPPWAPCRLPTCTNTPWSLSTTRSLHQRSTRGPPATTLYHRLLLLRWPAPTSAAWAASPSWSLRRTGTAPLSSPRGGSKWREGVDEGRGTNTNEDGLPRLTFSSSFFTEQEFSPHMKTGSAVVLRRETEFYWSHNRAH